MTQPDDPWAKWRQPAAAVDVEKAIKTEAVTPAAEPVTAEAVAPVESAVKPVGTLGVRKGAAASEALARHKPVRAGAKPKRPTLAEKQAAAEQQRAKPKSAPPAESKPRRPSAPESPWQKAVVA